MSATRTRKEADSESVPQAPQSTPASLGMPGHDFTLQAVMELQKSVGELNATMHLMKSSLDGVKAKVDDLVGWKNRIAGGFAVLLIVGGVVGFLIGKASDYLTLKQPVAVTPATPLVQVVPVAPTASPQSAAPTAGAGPAR